MNTFLVILLILAMAGALFSLIRGIVAFLQATKDDLNTPAGVPLASSLKQNKMMFNRVAFQAGAVLIVALLLLLNGGSQ
jgi:hypothetical protein